MSLRALHPGQPVNIPPPRPPACAGEDPQLFEFDLFYQAGLAICETCTVRSWCLRQVDPIRYRAFEGVAGGFVWKEGTPRVADLTDAALLSYLGTRLPPKPGRPKGNHK